MISVSVIARVPFKPCLKFDFLESGKRKIVCTVQLSGFKAPKIETGFLISLSALFVIFKQEV